MKAFFVLSFLAVCAYSAPTFNTELDSQWTLFKTVYEKQYTTAEETIR